jgi:formate hydrogenlyase transcriptional activator
MSRGDESTETPQDDSSVLCSDLDLTSDLYQAAPIRICLLDRELRFIQVDNRLAGLGGLSVEENVGKTIQEVLPAEMVKQVEPVCRQVLETGERRLGMAFRGPSPAEPERKDRHWRVSFEPLEAGGGDVDGICLVVQDVTAQFRKEQALRERLDFEQLVAYLSTRFLNLPAGEVDDENEHSLQQVAEHFLVDRGSVVMLTEDEHELRGTHSFVSEGAPPFTRTPMPSQLPFWASVIRRGDVYTMKSVDDLPPEAAAEKVFCEKRGIRSTIQLPLHIGGRVKGVIAFSTLHTEREWPDEVVERLRLVGDIFNNALERQRGEEKLVRHFEFERLIADLSARFVNLSVDQVDREIESGLKAVTEFLGNSRSGLVDVSADGTHLRVRHTYALPGVEPSPPELLSEFIPNFTQAIFRGEVFQSTVDELPQDWVEESRYMKESGLLSNLTIPLVIGESCVGFLTIDSFDVPRKFSGEIIPRLLLVGEVFTNAMARQIREREIERLKSQLETENIYLREEIRTELRYEEMVAQSRAMKSVLRQAEKVASTDSTVLLTGETGTGKEVLARAIHAFSDRRERVMVNVNCAALPSTLVESELFGREEGAFTGALSQQLGRFEVADGSTIFLDEISELPLELQPKLLRVLQEGEFERLGSPETVSVDVRIITATNRNLEQAVAERRFREDLLYRLNVFPIIIPPLRERQEDIPPLVWKFVEEFGRKMGKPIEAIPRKTMEQIKRHPWPGNIRELRNVIERAMILNEGPQLQVQLPQIAGTTGAHSMTMNELEKNHILEVLEKTGWKVSGPGGAAEILGMKHTTLGSRMKKLGIQRPG